MDGTAKLEKAPSQRREVWARRAEFVLASVGYAVGSGNVWRFPFICYRNGGGAFLIPYVTMVVLVVIPMVFLEFVLGQSTQRGTTKAFALICPLMKGLGFAPVIMSYLTCIYFNTIVGWTLFYLLSSFSNPLPWTYCNATWNVAENCSTSDYSNATHLSSPSQQFFNYRLLGISEGIDMVGNIQWQLVGLIVLAWLTEYLCLFKGLQLTGKVVYFTSLFPYVVLLSLLINNVRLPGATDGILFFLTPQWHRLREVQIWIDAASLILFSTGVGFGVMVSMASYNKFSDILRDCVVVCVANSATSIFAGLVIFSAIGYLAHLRHLPVEDIAVAGPGLAFIVYPEILTLMPVAQLWAVMFFFMLFLLCLGSQFPLIEVAVTFVKDSFGAMLPPSVRRKEVLVALVCIPGFLLNILCVTQGGVYLFNLMDHFTASMSVLTVAFSEVAVVIWIFGIRRFSVLVQRITGRPPPLFFKACWLVITPVLLFVILITSFVQYSPPRYGKSYEYPVWAQVLGWMFTLASMVWIPLGALHELYLRKGTLIQRLRASVVPELSVIDPPKHQRQSVPLSSI
ncbi:sodium- and chloride-dependent GABA transporter 2-like [Engraulis encrasicolus]|uniref:sodium- and chloride-dependent GABA transporter 2-like n=1 Tax=Engraulis encrasicolus TaxID=184585 RepID=UPI002FD4269C